jgi:PAT family acetyl-CoA transporter-like MFS transporter 1
MCNSIGQSFGYFIANQGFLALSDATWCHRFLGLPMGETMVTLAGFMRAGGWVFVITTFLLFLFKKERPIDPADEPEGLIETYQHVAAIFKLRPVQLLVVILLTCRVAYTPADAVSNFKMQVSLTSD